MRKARSKVKSKFVKYILAEERLHTMFGEELRLDTTSSGKIVIRDAHGNMASPLLFDHPEDIIPYLEYVEKRATGDVYIKHREEFLAGDGPNMSMSQFFDSSRGEVKEAQLDIVQRGDTF